MSWKTVVDFMSWCSSTAFLILLAVLFFVRLDPIEKAKGIGPRIQAIAGTFLMSTVAFFPDTDLTVTQRFIASSVSLTGTSLVVLALVHLGRSFSLMAEARRLVTTGPYKYVRHPLYLFEAIAILGVLFQHLSPYTVVIFVVHVLIQLTRMRNEEMVLQNVFPEYKAYKNRTAKLIPKLY